MKSARLGFPLLPLLAGTILLSPGCSLNMEEPTAQDHVLILPGIRGGPSTYHRLEDALDNASVSNQAWDWRWFSGRAVGSTNEDASTRRAASELASKVSGWKQSHPGTRLHIIAISGATLVTWLACNQTAGPDYVIDRGDIETIVLLSGSLRPNRDTAPLVTATNRGVFNYAQTEDDVLALLGRPAVGVDGFDNPAGVAQATIDPVARYGAPTHVACLEPGFINACLVPLIDDPSVSDWDAACSD